MRTFLGFTIGVSILVLLDRSLRHFHQRRFGI
jgi:hypothetical protein